MCSKEDVAENCEFPSKECPQLEDILLSAGKCILGEGLPLEGEVVRWVADEGSSNRASIDGLDFSWLGQRFHGNV